MCEIGKSVIANQLCPVCWSKKDVILLQMKTPLGGQKGVGEFKDKSIGYADKPCNECSDFMKRGIIVFSTKDDDQDYRTGGFWVVTDEVIERWLEEPLKSKVLKARMVLITDSVALEIGLEKID